MPSSAGLLRLFQNGTEIVILPGGNFKLGGVVDEPTIAGTQVFASGKMEASEIEVTAIIPTGMTITQAFPRGVDLDVALELDTGQSFSWPAMRIKGAIPVEVGTDKGAKLNYFGGTPIETQAT